MIKNKSPQQVLEELQSIGQNFDQKWKDSYSFFPEVVDLSPEERAKWREFAWRLVNNFNVDLCNQFEDALEKVRDATINEIKNAIDNM